MLRSVRHLGPRVAATYRQGSLQAALQPCRPLSAGSNGVVEVFSDKDYEQEVQAADGAVGIFTAKWCGPCKVMAPVYNQLASLYPDVRFLKVDIDTPSLEKTVMDNGIASVPTYVSFKGGRQAGKFSGADPQQLKKMLDDLR